MTSQKSVLVIDDDEAIREIMQIALEMDGYKVILAENGKEALEILHKIKRPDLILLDLMMPIMDGREFMKLLESDNELSVPEMIPVILVTAFNTNDFKGKIKDIIMKPMHINEFLEKVQMHCNGDQ